MPKDSEIGIIASIFKNGDNNNSKNSRRITLLSTIEIEPTLLDGRSEFCKWKDIQNRIFVLKEIKNKTLEKTNNKIYRSWKGVYARIKKCNQTSDKSNQRSKQ